MVGPMVDDYPYSEGIEVDDDNGGDGGYYADYDNGYEYEEVHYEKWELKKILSKSRDKRLKTLANLKDVLERIENRLFLKTI